MGHEHQIGAKHLVGARHFLGRELEDPYALALIGLGDRAMLGAGTFQIQGRQYLRGVRVAMARRQFGPGAVQQYGFQPRALAAYREVGPDRADLTLVRLLAWRSAIAPVSGDTEGRGGWIAHCRAVPVVLPSTPRRELGYAPGLRGTHRMKLHWHGST